MRWRTLLLICCLPLFGSPAGNRVASSSFRRAVQQLGKARDSATPSFDSDARVTIESVLSQHPHEAVKLLVAELHVIPDIPFVRWEVRDSRIQAQAHVVWCVRALRYLTGQEFKAPTRLPLAQPKEGFAETSLYGESNPKDRSISIPFAAEWPSRGQVCIAPEDAQAAMIAQWKAWVEEHKDFKPALLDSDQVDWFY